MPKGCPAQKSIELRMIVMIMVKMIMMMMMMRIKVRDSDVFQNLTFDKVLDYKIDCNLKFFLNTTIFEIILHLLMYI